MSAGPKTNRYLGPAALHIAITSAGELPAAGVKFCLAAAVLLAAATLLLALRLRLGSRFTLLLAGLLYPCGVLVAAVNTSNDYSQLLMTQTLGGPLATELGPILVLAVVAAVAATGWRFPRIRPSADPDEPTLT